MKRNPYSNFNEINCEFTAPELMRAIRNLKKKKSPGVDTIPNEVLQQPSLSRCLVTLFNFCFFNHMIPEDWSNCIITPIPKSSLKDPFTPINYRGIALLSCVGKLYSSVLNFRLTNYLDTTNSLSDCQNGFRKKRSCQDHIFALTSIINQNKSLGKDTFCCFVDFEKFFDYIDRNLLLLKLARIGIEGNFYWAINSLYHNTQCNVKLRSQFYSGWFTSDGGVRQGDPISPTLASIFLNDLLTEINSDNLTLGLTNILAYADDIVLIASSEVELQNLIEKTRNWCDKWLLTINNDKTNVVHFRNARKQCTKHVFRWDNKEIEKSDFYEYLGVFLDYKLNFEHHFDEVSAAAGRALGKIISKFKEMKNVGYKTFTKLFETGVDSVISYGAEIWGTIQSKKLERVQHRACRYFLGVNPFTALPFLYGDMGWLPCMYKQYKHVVRFWNRMIKMPDTRLTKRIFLRDLLVSENTNNVFTWSKKFYQLASNLNFIDNYRNRTCINFDDDVALSLTDLAERNWKHALSLKPKLRSYRTYKETLIPEPYVILNMSRHKRCLMAQIRSGTLGLNIEVGRHRNVKLDDRICQFCTLHEVESEFHFVMRCPTYENFRTNLINKIRLTLHNIDDLNKELQFCEIMSNFQIPLSKFISSAWEKRNSLLNPIR